MANAMRYAASAMLMAYDVNTYRRMSFALAQETEIFSLSLSTRLALPESATAFALRSDVLTARLCAPHRGIAALTESSGRCSSRRRVDQRAGILLILSL